MVSDGARTYFAVDLVGTRSNRDAFGARVFVRAGKRTQLRQRDGGVRDSVQDHQVLHFGLGENETIEDLIVQWPNAEIERFAVGDANRSIVLEEGMGTPQSGENGIVVIVGAETLESDKKVPFMALVDPGIDRATVRWSASGEDVCPGQLVCWLSFAGPGEYVVSASADLPTGKRIVATRHVTVIP